MAQARSGSEGGAGSKTPEILVELADCEAGQRQVRGSACVLAFCARWPEERGAGDALRAELRGLGAELVVLLPHGGVHIRPDDTPQALRPAPRLWSGFGVTPPERGGPALTLILLDARGAVRLRRESEVAEDPQAVLLDALGVAGQAARARPRAFGLTRRELLLTSLASALAVAVLDACAGTAARPEKSATAAASAGAGAIEVSLVVNGAPRTLRIDPRTTLLDALRENLGLTGTKKGCDMGQCGACTVLVEGQRIDSCLALAIQHDGRKITTIEGLAEGEGLHPMQAAFLARDAFQCGYCTPGQILSAVALLSEDGGRTDAAIREGMSGNICRCGAYPNILAAIRDVQGRS
jgi:xanthine dehydrogenase YagT iron-sulfur-binding subunit